MWNMLKAAFTAACLRDGAARAVSASALPEMQTRVGRSAEKYILTLHSSELTKMTKKNCYTGDEEGCYDILFTERPALGGGGLLGTAAAY